jgi:hypothetical protein
MILNDDLYLECVARNKWLRAYDQDVLFAVGAQLGRAPEACLQCFSLYQDQDGALHSGLSVLLNGLTFSKRETKVVVKGADARVELEEDDFFTFLGVVSDCYLPILPLGSVVRLKKEMMLKGKSFGELEHLDVVITDRFLAHKELHFFFPYGGVIYPTGMYETWQRIHFGPQLVESVLQEGFSDDREETYALLMKKELLGMRGLHSMAFMDGEELSQMSDGEEEIPLDF